MTLTVSPSGSITLTGRVKFHICWRPAAWLCFRSPRNFDAILGLYRTDKLHLSQGVSCDHIMSLNKTNETKGPPFQNSNSLPFHFIFDSAPGPTTHPPTHISRELLQLRKETYSGDLAVRLSYPGCSYWDL